MILANLAGIFTCSGFERKEGRYPSLKDAGFLQGPISIICNQRSGKIVEITTKPVGSDPYGEEIIDASGLIATPGFIDSHTHSLFIGSRSSEFFERWSGKSYLEIASTDGGIKKTAKMTSESSDEGLISAIESRLRKYLIDGVTTVEVKTGYGLSPEHELRFLRLLKSLEERKDLPQIIPTFLGLHWIPPGWDNDSYTKEIIKLIPVIAKENLAQFVDAFPEQGFFSIENALELTKVAKESGLKTKIHSDELTPFGVSEKFISEGALSIDHCQFLPSSLYKDLPSVDTVVTLMPATSFFLDIKYADARSLINNGARVALATDFNPGTAPLQNIQFTMLLAASQFKMSCFEILNSVTYNAAAALDLDHLKGTIAQNKMADITCWKLEGLHNSKRILDEIILSQSKGPTLVVSKSRCAINGRAQNLN